MDVEKIATDRYRLRSHGHIMTVSAQDLRDIEAYATLHMVELEAEAQAAERVRRYNQEMDERNRISAENRDKPWLPLHDGE